MGKLTRLKQSPGGTLNCVQAACRGHMAAVFVSGQRGRFAIIGGSEVRWDHWLPGKPVEDMPFTSSLMGNQVEMF